MRSCQASSANVDNHYWLCGWRVASDLPLPELQPWPDLFRILREGTVTRQPTKNERGDWEAVIEKRIRGSRDAGVVTIILREKEVLIVKTVMWIKR